MQLVICNSTKDDSLLEPKKKISKFMEIDKTQVKSSCIRLHFMKFEAFKVCSFRLQ